MLKFFEIFINIIVLYVLMAKQATTNVSPGYTQLVSRMERRRTSCLEESILIRLACKFKSYSTHQNVVDANLHRGNTS